MMAQEDDFLQSDLDDEKTIEYIKNYLPRAISEYFPMMSFTTSST